MASNPEKELPPPTKEWVLQMWNRFSSNYSNTIASFVGKLLDPQFHHPQQQNVGG
jgi:hypothetical protein